MGRFLIVEDQAVLRKGVVKVFLANGHHVDDAADGETALKLLSRWNYDVVITDLKLPGISGMEVLRHAKSNAPATDVLIMTAYGTIETAIEAMKLGAFDFLQKPFGIPELEMRVEKALQQRMLKNEVDYLRHERDVIYRIKDFVGESPSIKKVYRDISRVAPSSTNVLITGETGTGKELIAGAIHYNSPRAKNSFVKINYTAIPENLLESELFGHEKGAFTGAVNQRIGRFEQANGGSILLDEIGDMSPLIQAKILRVIQDCQFERLGGNSVTSSDVRIIAATNKDLIREMERGTFREDLYYRLNVVHIHMPSLKERRADIPLLTDHFIKRFNGELKREVKGVNEQAMKTMLSYTWPGNVRELENTLERAVLMSDGDYLDVSDINISAPAISSREAQTWGASPLDLKDLEKEAVLEALRKTNYIQKDAAEILGISKRVMHYKIQQFGIKHPRWIKNR